MKRALLIFFLAYLNPAFSKESIGVLPDSTVFMRFAIFKQRVSIKLAYSAAELSSETIPSILLKAGESYRGLLFLGIDAARRAQFVDQKKHSYTLEPLQKPAEIQNLELLYDRGPQALAPDFDPESNIDPLFAEIKNDYHLVNGPYGSLTLDRPPLSSCKIEENTGQELGLPPIPENIIAYVKGVRRIFEEPKRNPPREENVTRSEDTGGADKIINVNTYFREFLSTALQLQHSFLKNPDPFSNLNIHEAIAAIRIPCELENHLVGTCKEGKCEPQNAEFFRAQEQIKTESHYTNVCSTTFPELNNGFSCPWGRCMRGICYACHPGNTYQNGETPNTCKMSYFSQFKKESADQNNCDNPPNKPDRTPCQGGLCFNGECKSFSELTPKESNGTQCPLTKKHPHPRYRYEGECRECDEKSPEKLLGIANCKVHPGLNESHWTPSRKSCSEPDICVHDEAAP